MKRQKNVSKKYSIHKVIDENTRGHESFKSTIDYLIENASKSNESLTYNEIANKLNITDDQFKNFYTTDIAPPEIFILLKSQYKKFLPGNIEIIAYEFEIEVDAPPDPMEEEEG
jgi:hypothetical protein